MKRKLMIMVDQSKANAQVAELGLNALPLRGRHGLLLCAGSNPALCAYTVEKKIMFKKCLIEENHNHGCEKCEFGFKPSSITPCDVCANLERLYAEGEEYSCFFSRKE